MLRSVLRRSAAPSSYLSSRGFASSTSQDRKVAISGAAGGIGQPLSPLMKLNPMVSHLSLYDIAGTPGVAVDVSRINSRSEVKLGKNGVEEVLGFGPLSDYKQQGLAWHTKFKIPAIHSIYEPIKPTFRPLSPHLPIYKPQTSSTVSITNRISGIILTTVPLSIAFVTLKLGPICLANESVYQALYYSSMLGPISLQITALAAAYHLVHGLHDLYTLFCP